MSSHHIVRDQQEPAVFIHRIDAFPTVTMGSLLEWSPTVICCEPSVPLYLQQGLKLDVALISLTEYNFWEEELRNQQPIEIIAIEEENFLWTGLELLYNNNHRSVNMITSGKYLPEVIDACVNWSHQMDIVILTEKYRHILYRLQVFKKWLPANSRLTLIPLNGGITLTTLGFDDNLTDDYITQELSLKRISEGEIAVHANGCPYLIVENL